MTYDQVWLQKLEQKLGLLSLENSKIRSNLSRNQNQTIFNMKFFSTFSRDSVVKEKLNDNE